MKAIKHILNSNSKNIEEWTKKYLKAEDYCVENKKECYITISFNKSQMRSNALNSLAACYYQVISDELGGSILDNKAYCKLHFGVDLLEIQGANFAENQTEQNSIALSASNTLKDIKFFLWDYQTKIRLMKSYKITSLMTTKIFCDYLKEIERHYSEKCGIILESKNATLRNNALNLG